MNVGTEKQLDDNYWFLSFLWRNKYKYVFQYHFGSGISWCFSACRSLCVWPAFFFFFFSSSSPVLSSVFSFLFFYFTFLFSFFLLCFDLFLSSFSCFGFHFCCLFFAFLAYVVCYWYSSLLFAGFCLFSSVLSVLFSLLPPACGASVLQVANQSAVSQEQVDNILQENDALRTNLAALEQVTNLENII